MRAMRAMREEQQGAMGEPWRYIYMNGCLGEDTLKHVEKNGERWITIGVYDILFCCFPMGDKT